MYLCRLKACLGAKVWSSMLAIYKRTNIMMKKKAYQKPTMKVVMLQQRCQILAGSVAANRSSYGAANSGVDSDELDTNGNWEWE